MDPGHTVLSPAFSPCHRRRGWGVGVHCCPDSPAPHFLPQTCEVRLHRAHCPRTHDLQNSLLGVFLMIKVTSIHFRKPGKFEKANRKTPLIFDKFTLPCFSLVFSPNSLICLVPEEFHLTSNCPSLNPTSGSLSPEVLSYPFIQQSTGVGHQGLKALPAPSD